LRIDFHSHILPGVDHGSKSLDETKRQLDIISKSGVDKVVATSHFYPHVHSVKKFISNVDSAIEIVSELGDSYRDTDILVGAEVLACEMIDQMEGLEELCIRGTRCILLEMPTAINWGASLMGTVENLIDNGYYVVLAHIDRYIRQRKKEIDRLLSMGAKAQINADSLASFFDRKKLIPYIDDSVVCAIGSDMHGANAKEYKLFSDVERYIGKGRFDMVMEKSFDILRDAKCING